MKGNASEGNNARAKVARFLETAKNHRKFSDLIEFWVTMKHRKSKKVDFICKVFILLLYLYL